MTRAEQEQHALDQYSRELARLGHEQRMVAVTNAFVFADNSEPATVISALAQVMVGLAVHLDDTETQLRVAKALRDAADMFEQRFIRKAAIN